MITQISKIRYISVDILILNGDHPAQLSNKPLDKLLDKLLETCYCQIVYEGVADIVDGANVKSESVGVDIMLSIYPVLNSRDSHDETIHTIRRIRHEEKGGNKEECFNSLPADTTDVA